MESQDAHRVHAALNVLRTHYTPSQRAMFEAGRANATKADTAKFRASTNSKFRVGAPTTVAQAAAEAGVSSAGVAQAKAIARTAAPEVVDGVKSGKLTLHAANHIAQLPKPDQPAAVEKAIAASKGKARHTPTAAG